jgi:hypothetical protein
MAVFFTISPSAGRLVGCATVKSVEVVTLPLPARRDGPGRGPRAAQGSVANRVAGYDFGNPLESLRWTAAPVFGYRDLSLLRTR